MKSLRILAMLALVGCGGDDDPPSIDANGGGTPDAGGGATELTVTADTTSIGPGGEIVLTITPPTGFAFVDPSTNTTNMAGQGHYHVYLDNATGGDYLANDFESPVTITVPADTAAGAHQLHVDLFQNDHTPVDPPVRATVDITVQ